jgi:hypothetical protein
MTWTWKGDGCWATFIAGVRGEIWLERMYFGWRMGRGAYVTGVWPTFAYATKALADVSRSARVRNLICGLQPPEAPYELRAIRSLGQISERWTVQYRNSEATDKSLADALERMVQLLTQYNRIEEAWLIRLLPGISAAAWYPMPDNGAPQTWCTWIVVTNE